MSAVCVVFNFLVTAAASPPSGYCRALVNTHCRHQWHQHHDCVEDNDWLLTTGLLMYRVAFDVLGHDPGWLCIPLIMLCWGMVGWWWVTCKGLVPWGRRLDRICRHKIARLTHKFHYVLYHFLIYCHAAAAPLIDSTSTRRHQNLAKYHWQPRCSASPGFMTFLHFFIIFARTTSRSYGNVQKQPPRGNAGHPGARQAIQNCFKLNWMNVE